MNSAWRNSSTLMKFPQTAIILAGGLGTRLRTVVADRPKVLAPVAGQPFLNYVLNHVVSQGVQNIVLSAGYLAGQVQAFATQWQTIHPGYAIRIVQEEAPLGTGGALRLASAELKAPFFALNGDTLFKVNLLELWQAHHSSTNLATIALLSITSHQARGYVDLADNGKIKAFIEKPPAIETANPATALVNGGVYLLEPAALANIAPGKSVSIERVVFPELACQKKLGGIVQSAYFADIGTPESLAAFEQDIYAGVVE